MLVRQGDDSKIKYHVGGMSTCPSCFQDTCVIGKDTLRRVRNAVLGGEHGLEDATQSRQGPDADDEGPEPGLFSKSAEVDAKMVAWFESFVSDCSDEMPESTERHLPIQFTWTEILKQMRAGLDKYEPGCKLPGTCVGVIYGVKGRDREIE